MTNQIKLLDVVALTVDLPDHNLWRGQVGTVAEILADSTAYEIEFSDREGRTYESLGLRPTQIIGGSLEIELFQSCFEAILGVGSVQNRFDKSANRREKLT